jgi:transcriptional regulator with PAS, ATPase and Fis domain
MLTHDVFDTYLRRHGTEVSTPSQFDPPIRLRDPLPTMKEVETFLIREALRQSRGNQSAAAKILGLSQSTLSRWLQRAGENMQQMYQDT